MSVQDVLARVRFLDLPAYGDGEVLFMASALERFKPTHVFDWGTNVGASARIFYEASHVLGYPCEIHSIELPLEEAWRDRDHPGKDRYAELLQGVPVYLHRGDGLAVSIRLCVELEPAFPLFFLDGCHDHDVVLEELSVISNEEPRAVMLIHDTNKLTGSAVREFLWHSAGYTPEEEITDSGMMALWPLP